MSESVILNGGFNKNERKNSEEALEETRNAMFRF